MDENENAELTRFAQLLMTLVRDAAIGQCDRLARGEMRGPSGERWRQVIAQKSAQAALLDRIPAIVDQTLFEVSGAPCGSPRQADEAAATERDPRLLGGWVQLVSMAMNGWGAAEPAWWLNLQADPQAVVELAGGIRREVLGRSRRGA